MAILLTFLVARMVTGVIGIFISVVAIVGAVRLAKPGSWWAQHRYATKARLANRAARRYDQRHQDRWNRLRDLVAGAPSEKSVLKQMSGIVAAHDREDLFPREGFSADSGEKPSPGENPSRSWHNEPFPSSLEAGRRRDRGSKRREHSSDCRFTAAKQNKLPLSYRPGVTVG